MRCSPSSPLIAVSTSNPSISSRVCKDSRISASSSIMSTDPEEDGLVFSGREITASSDMDRLPAQGKIEGECCALAGVALDAYFAGVLLDDAVGYRKSESSAAILPFPRRTLSCKKWIVNTLHVFRVNSGTGI